METSESVSELAKALAEAQLEFKPIVKDVKNPYYGQMYADLSSVIRSTQPALAKHELVVVQTAQTNIEAQEAIITTRLIHSSGQWLSNDLNLPATMQGKGGEPRFDAQSIGSAMTYGRRYGYQGIVGVCAEADDDGNATLRDNGNAKPAQRPPSKSNAPQKPNEVEITQLKVALVSTCKLLNAAGDKPLWGTKRLDEFANQEYGKKADDLELEPLRELLKKLSNKLDATKKASKEAPNAVTSSIDDKVEQERQAKIKAIQESVAREAVDEAIERLKYDKPLTELTLDQLVALSEEICQRRSYPSEGKQHDYAATDSVSEIGSRSVLAKD